MTKIAVCATLGSDRTPHASRKIGAPRGGIFCIMAYQPGSQPSLGSLLVGDQIQSLIDRGMEITDQGFAVRCLNHIGYHRLASYWWPFQQSSSQTASFRPGTVFDQVMTRYMFDQRLRSLLLEALSYVEISVRNQWSRELVQRSSRGEYAHLDPGLFDPVYYSDNLQELKANYDRVRGQKGPDFQSADIWDLAPTMSFGSLSKWYSSLADPGFRQSISANYGVDGSTLRSALRYLTAVRNTCAHHERIWNLTIKPGLRIPRELGGSREMAQAFNKNVREKIYNGLVMVTHLMEVITPNGDWPERLFAFREAGTYSSVPYRNMGFPDGWREFATWQRYLPQEKDVEAPA